MKCFTTASYNSFLLLYPILYIFINYELTIPYLYVFTYIVYIIFFSFIHNYYYLTTSIYAFLDRAFVRISIIIYLILLFFKKLSVRRNEFIFFVFSGVLYLISMYTGPRDYSNKISNYLHIFFRITSFTYFYYILLVAYKNKKIKKNIIIYIILQILFTGLLAIYDPCFNYYIQY